ncbi:hypothetical protein GCM10010967_16880 [Dyadobacter beijingensis]|uniref:Uncharacterized protein n=1 Tax=Dyadobacter beijingensis TaxID=365489 RepID=A0ABQ2HLJ4_9BACT|nr:hypothetical protein [Dyadobacter beijingensis]GGM85453.1 hypothetical protein GCM10010967_16880 [Dyadobacter beijingensis]
MVQLLQNIFDLAPVLVTIVLFGAALGGFWLVIDLKKRGSYHRYSVGDRLFIKRNANRLRKIQLH